MRYPPDRKNLLMASEAQPWTFFTAKGVCLPLAPPCQIPQLCPSSLLAWLPAGNTRLWRGNVTPKHLTPQDLDARKSSQSRSVKLHSNNKN